MKGAKLTVRLDDGEVRRYVAAMQRRGKDVKPYFKRLGAWMAFRSIPKTFRLQGRPAGRWRSVPLSPMTIALRRWRADPKSRARPHRAYHEKILIQSGDLMNKNTYRIRGQKLEVGTALRYGAHHQFGGWVAAPARWERPMVKIPKREWLGIWQEDERWAEQQAVRYLEKG